MNAPAEATPRAPATGRRYVPLAVTAGVVVIADQITKDIALDHLQDAPVHLIPGWLDFRLVYNTGAAFGLGRGWPLLFLAVTLGVVATIAVVTPRLRSAAFVIPLGMVSGGGLSNVADRIFRGRSGRVIDFIDLHHWPVFNLADSAIVIGIFLTMLLSWAAGHKQ